MALLLPIWRSEVENVISRFVQRAEQQSTALAYWQSMCLLLFTLMTRWLSAHPRIRLMLVGAKWAGIAAFGLVAVAIPNRIFYEPIDR